MKLDVYVDATETESWIAVAGQIGDTFGSNPELWKRAFAVQEDDRSKDIEKRFLIFSLDGASTLTSEQKEFFEMHKYFIQFSEKRELTDRDPRTCFCLYVMIQPGDKLAKFFGI